MNLNFLGRHGVKLALAATIVGSLTFASCEKETFDVNGTGKGQTIEVPATDLTQTNELIQQILTLVKEQQYTQLQALLDAINGGNAETKSQLQEIIDQLKATDTNNTAKFDELSSKLDNVISAINALNDKMVSKFDAAIEALNNKDNGSAATIEAINSAVEALKTANAENAQNIVNGLKSDYTDLLKELKTAIENQHDAALDAKLDKVIEAINNKETFTKADLADITSQLNEILTEIKNNKEAVEAVKTLVEAQNGDVATLKTLIESMISSMPASLQKIVDDINNANKVNADALESALTELKNSNKEGYDKIIALLADDGKLVSAVTELNNKAEKALAGQEAAKAELEAIKEAVNGIKTSNTELAQKLQDAIEAAIKAASDKNTEDINKNTEELGKILLQLQKDDADIYNKLIEIIVSIDKASAELVEDPSTLGFIPQSEIDAVKETAQTEEVSPVVTGSQDETGAYLYAVNCEIPNVGAWKYTESARQKMLEAIENDVKVVTTSTGSKAFTRADVDEDLLKAKAMLKKLVNELSTSWSSVTNSLFMIKGTTTEKVTSVTATFNEKFDEVPVALYAAVNGKKYYILGTKAVATVQPNEAPVFKVVTESGEVSHDGTSHDYSHDHGHGNGNAGGGIGGK